MSYFKHRSLGAIISRPRLQTTAQALTTPVVAISQEQAAANERDRAWVASLEICGLRGRLYQKRDGTEICTEDPIKARNNELRSALRIVPILISTPIGWRDGQWIGGQPKTPISINRDYLILLLGAQANPEGQAKASAARVTWNLSRRGEPFLAERQLVGEEFSFALNKMLEDFGPSSEWYKIVKKAATSKEAEQELRLLTAKIAKAHADIAGIKEQMTDADNFFCSQTMGLSPELMPCCLKFVTDVKPGFPHDKQYEEYAKRFAKQDPSVMACLHKTQQAGLVERGAEERAKHKKLLIMAAGAVGVVVIGAALLTGKKGKR